MAAGRRRAELAGVERGCGSGGMPVIGLGQAIYRPLVRRISERRSPGDDPD